MNARLSIGICIALLACSARAARADVTVDESQLHNEFVWVDPPAVEANEISKIIFLNRCPGGCVVFPGSPGDARSDSSSIVSERVTLSAFAHGDEAWDAVVACVTELYAPYDVVITDVDPGPETLHHEAIVAGTPTEAGLSPYIGGVAPGSTDCKPQNNVISFTFANTYAPSSVLSMCATIGQESAHAWGLDHEFDCRDPMTYLGGCGQKYFRNEWLPCGEFTERPCSCSGLTQNSHFHIEQVFGPGTPPPPPELEVVSPVDGASVEDGFLVSATSSDKRGVFKVEMFVNGWLYETTEGHSYSDRNDPYTLRAPPSLPDGVQHLDIVSSNDLGSSTTVSLTVTKGAPCASAAACIDGQDCLDGACTWPTPTGDLGDQCAIDQNCVSLLCASASSDSLCTETCFTGVNDFCPDGFECVANGASASGVCWPEGTKKNGGGGCAVGNGTGWSASSILVLLAALLLVRRRRQ